MYTHGQAFILKKLNHNLTFLIIVRHVVCNHISEVQEEVPRVLGN